MWMHIKTVQTKMHNRSSYLEYIYIYFKSIDNDGDDDVT